MDKIEVLRAIAMFGHTIQYSEFKRPLLAERIGWDVSDEVIIHVLERLACMPR